MLDATYFEVAFFELADMTLNAVKNSIMSAIFVLGAFYASSPSAIIEESTNFPELSLLDIYSSARERDPRIAIARYRGRCDGK